MWFPAICSVEVLSIWSGVHLKPSSVIMFGQNNGSLNLGVAPTRSASIGHWTVDSCTLTLNLTGIFHGVTMYDEVYLSLSGRLRRSASEHALILNPPCL